MGHHPICNRDGSPLGCYLPAFATAHRANTFMRGSRYKREVDAMTAADRPDYKSGLAGF